MKRIFLIALVVVSISCDHGLAPPLASTVEPGFGGTVYYEKGTWPVADSLFNLWLFASQVYPLDSAKVFEGLFATSPYIFLYPAIDKNLLFFVDSVSYSFKLPPAEYKYIGVIQRFASDLTVRTLRVVGMYGTKDIPPQPLSVKVSENTFVTGIDLKVNFRKPPPQPF